MAVNVRESVVDGLVMLDVTSNSLQLRVVPQVGGKVISLQERSTGREFLWRHPDRTLRPVPYGAAFEEYDISGWDECFPTIGEVVYPQEPWKGVVVPDHGELWTLPWQWQQTEDALRMWTHSVRFGYHFERTFRLRDEPNHGAECATLEIVYKAHNPTPFPLHALWSMHPFFHVSPSSRVLLPPEVNMRIEISSQARIGHFLSEVPWPLTQDHLSGQEIDLSVMGSPQPTTEKLYSTQLSEGWAALYHADDDSFVAFTFDPDQIPYMGVCQIRGGWPIHGTPTYSMLLEPCTGWPDRLDLAMSRGAGMILEGGATLEWQLNLHLGRTRSALETIIGRPLDYLFESQI